MRAGLTWLLEISRQANTLCGQELRGAQWAQLPSETKPESGPPKPSASASSKLTFRLDHPMQTGHCINPHFLIFL